MCGRFVRAKTPEAYQQAFDLRDVPSLPSYNVAPTQGVVAVRADTEQRTCSVLRWGLIPFWARDAKTTYINARSETVVEKPAFRASLKKRRCLVLADGFFEWRTEGKQKVPFYFRMRDDAPFAFAGLWDRWDKGAEPIESCTLITTSADELSQPIHDRMPVLLRGAAAQAWLDPDVDDPQALVERLRPYPSAEMVCYPVATVVNNVKNNRPECIDPIGT